MGLKFLLALCLVGVVFATDIAGMTVDTKVDIVKNVGKMKQTTQFHAVE